MGDSPTALEAKVQRASQHLRELGRVAVAFSGGVDSSVLLKLAADVLGPDNVLAVTATGPIFPADQAVQAEHILRSIPVKHVTLAAHVHKNSEFIKNTAQRCYHCKIALMSSLQVMAQRLGFGVVIAGENADDGLDYRPGHRALVELKIHCPLKEARLTKAEVRQLARRWGLPNWSQPPTPCLATRIPYGQHISTELLGHIDEAETFIRSLGFDLVRIRIHGPVARVEVQEDRIADCFAPDTREKIVAKLKEVGFTYVTVDLEGYQSGSLNKLLAKTD